MPLPVWPCDHRCAHPECVAAPTYVAGDLLDRASDLQAHYSDTGVLPRTAVFNYFWNTNWISLHMMNGTARWEALLFLMHGIAAFCMAIGLYTKFSTVVSWFLLVSLHSRNPLVLHGGTAPEPTTPLTYARRCVSAHHSLLADVPAN